MAEWGFTLFALLTVIGSGSFVTAVHISSPIGYHYRPVDIDMTRRHVIKFTARACADVHIKLQAVQSGQVDIRGFEIVIGGWGNTKSAIRSGNQGFFLDEDHTAHRLDCHSDKSFWVSWRNAVIQVGEGDNSHQGKFLEANIVRSITISSGLGHTSIWGTDISSPTDQGNAYHLLNFYSYRLLSGSDFRDRYSFTYIVKTCADAHVALQPTRDVIDPAAFEINVGGWANTKSAIRSGHLGTFLAETQGARVECEKPKKFWITWSGNKIQVGSGFHAGQSKFMEAPLIRIVALTSGSVNGVEWEFDI